MAENDYIEPRMSARLSERLSVRVRHHWSPNENAFHTLDGLTDSLQTTFKAFLVATERLKEW